MLKHGIICFDVLMFILRYTITHICIKKDNINYYYFFVVVAF